MDLEFRDLTYTVRSRLVKGQKKVVVKGVHGRFLSGQLVAIMGPSGAGKSSLLNAISGYRVIKDILKRNQGNQIFTFHKSYAEQPAVWLPPRWLEHDLVSHPNQSAQFYYVRLVTYTSFFIAPVESSVDRGQTLRSAGVTGELLVNGQPRDEHLFQRSSCYITQEDLLQPLLTVREAMDVAARLKLPRGVKAPSEEILQELGLLEHQHTKTDQLSGGQKKRLSIALEMVNNPPVFFLDEPTSGLDTVTTTQCVKLLKQLARQGRTVVCTIHQPAASLLEMFDQVYVIADGRCIYQGDTMAMVPHLQSVGLPCPRHHNPADFIIELTENLDNITLLSNEMLNGKIYKPAKLESSTSEPVNNLELKICYQTDDNDQETEIMLSNEKCTYKVPQYNEHSASLSSLSSQISQVNSSMAWMKVQISTDSCGYPTTFFEQFSILLCRMIKQISRNRQGLWIQFIHHVMCGILIGICFFNMANDGTQMFNHLKFCVGIVIFFAYTQIMVPVLVYPNEVKLVKKEHFNCWYSLFPYYAALTVSKIPVQVTLNIVFCTIVYFMTGVPFNTMRFIVFCIVGNVVSLAAEGMGLAIGSIFSVTNGCAIGPSAIAPFLGLAIYGFDFAHEIPLLMNILMKTSFIRCGIVAMVLTIFGFNRKPLECSDIYCHFAKPDVLIKYLDIEATSVWFEIAIMVTIMLVFRSVCFLGLKWRFAT